MSLMPFRNGLDVFAKRRSKRSLDGIWSPEEFRAILDRERARVDRNEHTFSLVVFDGTSMGRKRDLEHELSSRVRATDEVGWFDRQHLGVLLTDTPAEGARKLANDICQRMTATGSSPVCTVYTYPSKRVHNGNDHSGRSRFDKSSGADAPTFDHTSSTRQDRMQDTRRPRKKLESLVARDPVEREGSNDPNL